MRRQAFYGEGTGDADFFVVFVGLVVEVFVVGFGGDGSVDFLLPGDALFPPIRVNSFDLLGPSVVGVAGDFPFLVGCAERVVQFRSQWLQRFLEFLIDYVDSALLAMDLRVMWGTRSYTKPWRISLYVDASEGTLRASSASLIWPSRLSASR